MAASLMKRPSLGHVRDITSFFYNNLVLNRSFTTRGLCNSQACSHNFIFINSGKSKQGQSNEANTHLVIPSRFYGRKVRPKPQKITHFEYSGDLRTLPPISKDTVLFSYEGLEDNLENDETLKSLSSVHFASSKEVMQHRKEQLRDRIVQHFGQDSELEQKIAQLTLGIRLMIPYCIQYKTDKLNKIWLLKRIFKRRRLLTQLRHIDSERFEWLLRELKIRYIIPRDKEEFKGWKHEKRVATEEEATALQRKKLEDLKIKFEKEKIAFYQRKAQILKEIEADLESMGMDRTFLDELQVVEKETLKPHKILTWDERVKLGMTGKIKEYYG